MLIGLDPILSPDLLMILRAMGHGDRLVVVDANFPAASSTQRLVRLDGVDAPRALGAILSVMPLDTYAKAPAVAMQVVGDPGALPEVVAEMQGVVNAVADTPAEITAIERFAFYGEASKAFAIVQTGERRPYGNLILTKGVVPPG